MPVVRTLGRIAAGFACAATLAAQSDDGRDGASLAGLAATLVGTVSNMDMGSLFDSAPAGDMPFKVSTGALPPAPSEGNIVKGILKAYVVGDCFVDDFLIGYDMCQKTAAGGSIFPICMRWTSNFPMAIHESSDTVGKVGMRWTSVLKYLKAMLPSITAASSKMNVTRQQDMSEGAGIADSVTRSYPPPLGVSAVSAMITVASLGNACDLGFTLKSSQNIPWFLSDLARGPGGGWKSIISGQFFTATGGWTMLTETWGSAVRATDTQMVWSWGQTTNMTVRSATQWNQAASSLVGALYTGAQVSMAPTVLPWGAVHTATGAPLLYGLFDKSAISPSGYIAAEPMPVYGKGKTQVIYAGTMDGCTQTSCSNLSKWFPGNGQPGRFWGSIFAQQTMSSREGDKVMTIAFHPYLTCCVQCIYDYENAIKRHVDFSTAGGIPHPKQGNEYLPALLGTGMWPVLDLVSPSEDEATDDENAPSEEEMKRREAKQEQEKKAAKDRKKQEAQARKDAQARKTEIKEQNQQLYKNMDADGDGVLSNAEIDAERAAGNPNFNQMMTNHDEQKAIESQQAAQSDISCYF